MLEKGKRIPNWKVRDADGREHELWDYRQKSHLVILYDPQASQETVSQWQKTVQAERQRWDWLHTAVLIAHEAPKEMTPGAYVIDRYGMFWNYFPPDEWSFEGLEKDLVYYEARHC